MSGAGRGGRGPSARRVLVTVLALVLSLGLGLLAGCTGSDGDAGRGGGDGGVGSRPATAQLPAPLPELELGAFGDGEPAQLADLRGPMVLNVWASYCRPCVTEMPVLEEFHRKHEGEIEVVGIDYTDVQVEAAERFAAEAGVTYPLYADLGGDLSRLGPFPPMRGLPFTAFIDEQGRLAGWEFVIIDDVAELEALVDKYLEVA